MEASQIPAKWATPWATDAASGYVNTIPATAPGAAASQTLGFPPITAANVGAGGVPPNIADINGLGLYCSSWEQWFQMGGPVAYDATLSTNIGGYPSGAVLAAASLGGFWLSTADNNVTDPDTGGAGWVGFSAIHGSQIFSVVGTFTFTVPAGVFVIEVALWGGGSGGQGNDGGSGCAGGYSWGQFSVTPGAVYTVTIGAGGAGSIYPTVSGAGGTSSVVGTGISMSCTGGMAVNSVPVLGGVGSGGQINLVGSPGWDIFGAGPTSAPGAPACVGGGGGSIVTGGYQVSPGAGGGAAYGGGVATDFGGNGGAGLCVVRW